MLGHRGYDVNSGFPSLSIEVVIAASSYEGIGVLLRFDAEHSEGSGCPSPSFESPSRIRLSAGATMVAWFGRPAGRAPFLGHLRSHHSRNTGGILGVPRGIRNRKVG